MIPAREQTPRENYRPVDRISVYVKNIDREARGPMIILSRAAPKLVEKLFQRLINTEGIIKATRLETKDGKVSVKAKVVK